MLLFAVSVLLPFTAHAGAPPLTADATRATTHGEVWPLPQKIQYLDGEERIIRGPVSISFEGVGAAECDILQHLKETFGKVFLFQIAVIDFWLFLLPFFRYFPCKTIYLFRFSLKLF